MYHFCHRDDKTKLKTFIHFTTDSRKMHFSLVIKKHSHILTFASISLVPSLPLPTDAADTTDLSTTLATPQFHPKAAGTHIFFRQLTRSEPKWRRPALKWLPVSVQTEAGRILWLGLCVLS